MRHAARLCQRQGLNRLGQLVSLIFHIDQAKAHQFVESFWLQSRSRPETVVLWLEAPKVTGHFDAA
jgi:hypothetical protein